MEHFYKIYLVLKGVCVREKEKEKNSSEDVCICLSLSVTVYMSVVVEKIYIFKDNMHFSNVKSITIFL